METAKKASEKSTAKKSASTTKKATTAKKSASTAKKTTAAKKSKIAASGSLVIVESPTKAKKISKFLGDKYTVIASNGHVRDLPKSTIGVDIENNFKPSYITVRGRGDLLDTIRKRAKVSKHIYLATDPDREGEAISWHLAYILGIPADTTCRIVFNEITESAVKNSLSNARAINQDLVDAQQARRVLDRLVGYEISPLLWRKVRRGLSAGRVQSVATRMICDREDEINAFVPEEYWTITAKLKRDGLAKQLIAKYYGMNDKKETVANETDAKRILEHAKNIGVFTVTDVKAAKKTRHAPAPFTTSSLQQEASRKLNMTSDKTMRVAQELYEGANLDSGLITYMRTDSVRVSAEAQQDALDYIRTNYGADYAPKAPNVYKSKSNAQDAHEAIRPTSLKNTPQAMKAVLSPQQQKVYKLIFDRFVASQMSEAIFESTTVTYDVEKHTYKTSGLRTIFAGYTAVYSEGSDEESEKDMVLPKVSVGDVFKLDDISADQHFTQPPARYTDATLVKAMDELGIGRPSTYAPTISTIIARGYVRRDKKLLSPTELGMIVTAIMKEHFADIVNLKFTADIESRLDKVEDGTEMWTDIISSFYGPFSEMVKKADASIEHVEIADEVSDIPCDKCGAMMVYKLGRFGRFLACPNYPECKNTKTIVQKIPTPCPKCGAAVIKRTTKTRKTFFGCERYPDCDFTSWDMPISKNCEACGAYMVQRVSDRGRYITCSNPECKTHNKRIKASEDSENDA